MAYLLRFDDDTASATGDYVTIASAIDIGTSDDFSIYIDATPANNTNHYRPLGGGTLSEPDPRVICFDTGTIRLTSDSGANREWALGINLTTINTLEFRRVSGQLDLYLNGVLQSGGFSSNTDQYFGFKVIGGNFGTTSRAFDLRRLQISKNSVLIHDYDPSASNGTGSTLPDTVGSNDGTLVNFPTDDSQWVFYSTGQTVAVGLVTETDSTFALGKAKAKTVGLSSTSDTALALSTAIVQAVGLVTETDATFALNSTKAKAVGLNTETNTTFALSSSKAKSTGQASETNATFGLTVAKAFSVGLTSETNAAFSVTAITPGGAVVGLAAETNTALSTTSAKVKAVGIASDTSTALAATASKSRTVGQASTLDSAAQLAILKSLSVGLAQTTDTAIPLSIAQVVEVGLAIESNTALALSVGFPLASWVYTVPVEQRIISVSAEQRSYTVPVEQRVIEVST